MTLTVNLAYDLSLHSKEYPPAIETMAHVAATAAVTALFGPITAENTEDHCEAWHAAYFSIAEKLSV